MQGVKARVLQRLCRFVFPSATARAGPARVLPISFGWCLKFASWHGLHIYIHIYMYMYSDHAAATIHPMFGLLSTQRLCVVHNCLFEASLCTLSTADPRWQFVSPARAATVYRGSCAASCHLLIAHVMQVHLRHAHRHCPVVSGRCQKHQGRCRVTHSKAVAAVGSNKAMPSTATTQPEPNALQLDAGEVLPRACQTCCCQ